jgi:hypothetical protein
MPIADFLRGWPAALVRDDTNQYDSSGVDDVPEQGITPVVVASLAVGIVLATVRQERVTRMQGNLHSHTGQSLSWTPSPQAAYNNIKTIQ